MITQAEQEAPDCCVRSELPLGGGGIPPSLQPKLH